MPSQYKTPEAIIVEWVGPFRLDEAPTRCSAEEVGQSVYVAFGRPKATAWWPLWFESRWVKSVRSASGFRLSNRAAAYPLQYVGIGGDPCDRAKASTHKHLGKLAATRSYVWYAKPVNYLDPEKKTRNGHQLAVFALEKALIFCLKPRLNTDEYDVTSAPVVAAWCRAQDDTNRQKIARRLLRRLPESIRFDPEGTSMIEFNAPIPEKHICFKLHNRRAPI